MEQQHTSTSFALHVQFMVISRSYLHSGHKSYTYPTLLTLSTGTDGMIEANSLLSAVQQDVCDLLVT